MATLVRPLRQISTYSEIALKCNPIVLQELAKYRGQGLITCTGKTDGAGAQAMAMLSTMLFAHDSGLRYVHTPFQQIEHNTSENSDWVSTWENFLNLGLGEFSRAEIENQGINLVEIQKLTEIPFRAPLINVAQKDKTSREKLTLYVVNNCHHYGNFFPNRYLNLIQALRDKYYHTSKSDYEIARPTTSTMNNQAINIAIHVRRGDVEKTGEYAIRYTSSHLIVSALEKALKTLSELGLEAKISLYSQGNRENFADFERFPVSFYLDECPFTTFHQLVCADILLMSKSTFSYMAALLSEGIKLYEPFWHRAPQGWIVTDRKMNFSQKILRCQLQRRFQLI